MTYTFMGWNEHTLPLIYAGKGEEFPAVLTHTSGLCKDLVALLRPLYNFGMRSDAISKMILESHSLEHTRLWILYERNIEAQQQDSGGDTNNDSVMFSAFNNP